MPALTLPRGDPRVLEGPRVAYFLCVCLCLFLFFFVCVCACVPLSCSAVQ